MPRLNTVYVLRVIFWKYIQCWRISNVTRQTVPHTHRQHAYSCGAGESSVVATDIIQRVGHDWGSSRGSWRLLLGGMNSQPSSGGMWLGHKTCEWMRATLVHTDLIATGTGPHSRPMRVAFIRRIRSPVNDSSVGHQCDELGTDSFLRLWRYGNSSS